MSGFLQFPKRNLFDVYHCSDVNPL